MEYAELLKSYDKKFYKLSEIEKIAKQQADKHKQERKVLSKLSHIVGSQQTAIDIYKDMNQEIELRRDETDPLEKISAFVHALIVTKKCELIISVKDCEYKDAFNKFSKEYLAEVKSFVDLQYKEEFSSVLLNHLKDALAVLQERGNLQAEKRLKELPDYEKLLTAYKLLTAKLNSLLIDFNPSALQECYSLLNLLKQNELSAKVAKTITFSLQQLYNEVIDKAREDIVQERNAFVPSIQAVIVAINNYLEIREAFNTTEVKFREENYSQLKEDLLTLQDEIKQETQHILEQASQASNPELNLLDSIVLNLSLAKEIDDYTSKYSYPYIEIKNEVAKIHKLKPSLNENIAEMKNLYLKQIEAKLIINPQISVEEQLSVWQEVEEDLTITMKGLNDKDINFPELVEQTAQFPTTRKKFVSLKINEYDFCKHYLKEYTEFLIMIAAKLPVEEAEAVKISEILKQIDDFKFNIKEVLQMAEKFAKIVSSAGNPMTYFTEYKKINDFVLCYNSSNLILFLDTKKDYELLTNVYPELASYVTAYIQEHAWQGNLTLQAPNSQVNIILLAQPQVIIGRSSGKGTLIEANRINLPWGRVSGDHLFVDFEQGVIKDLNSSNGTYINKETSKITNESLTKITEFNLATDLTFKTFYEPTAFSGLVFTNFSTNFEKAPSYTSKSELDDVLSKCFFIYLPPASSEVKLFIRKYDGKPIYGNEMLDYKDCFIIQRDKGVFYYSDYKEDIISFPILKEDNSKLKLSLREIII